MIIPEETVREHVGNALQLLYNVRAADDASRLCLSDARTRLLRVLAQLDSAKPKHDDRQLELVSPVRAR